MIYAFAIAETIVAPTLFRPEFLHSLDPTRTLQRSQISGLDYFLTARNGH
jgi:hypothetical protein